MGAVCWPLVETARTLLLTGFLALAWPGTMLQLLCGLLTAVSFLILQIWCAPYRTASNNALAVATDVSLVLEFISSVGVQINSLYDSRLNEEFLSVALNVATFSVFTFTLLFFLFKWLFPVQGNVAADSGTAAGASTIAAVPAFSRAAAAASTRASAVAAAVFSSCSHGRTTISAAAPAAEELLAEASRDAAINGPCGDGPTQPQ
jgi:hypothetical protein